MLDLGDAPNNSVAAITVFSISSFDLLQFVHIAFIACFSAVFIIWLALSSGKLFILDIADVTNDLIFWTTSVLFNLSSKEGVIVDGFTILSSKIIKFSIFFIIFVAILLATSGDLFKFVTAFVKVSLNSFLALSELVLIILLILFSVLSIIFLIFSGGILLLVAA